MPYAVCLIVAGPPPPLRAGTMKTLRVCVLIVLAAVLSSWWPARRLNGYRRLGPSPSPCQRRRNKLDHRHPRPSARTRARPLGVAVLQQAVDEIHPCQTGLCHPRRRLRPRLHPRHGPVGTGHPGGETRLGRPEAPLFPIPGNHGRFHGHRRPEGPRAEELYKKYFGPLYYSFDYRDAHFICLYTDEALQSAPHFSQTQLQWLQDDLAHTATSLCSCTYRRMGRGTRYAEAASRASRHCRPSP